MIRALARSFAVVSALFAGASSASCGQHPATQATPRAPAARATPGRTPEAPASGSTGSVADPDLKIARLGQCALDGGETIEDCHVGYRTFGKLDATKSNAILFPTWFTGTSKMLAKNVPERLVDTKRFFLVLVDALGDGVSSSPSNSASQPRLRFPRFTIHDMVESQRRLLHEVLGIDKLHAVMGTSMGGMQAFEWVVAHPDEVERMVAIVGSPQLTSQDLLLWNAELHILDDSISYAHGNYDGAPAIPGLQEVHWMNLATPELRVAETSRSDYAGWIKPKAYDVSFDWNDWHRQLEAMIAHDVARTYRGDLRAAASHVKAKSLIIVGDRDMMVNAEPAKIFAHAASGATLLAFDDKCGHGLQGCESQLPARVRAFLEGTSSAPATPSRGEASVKPSLPKAEVDPTSVRH
jgi:homoserine O-acetyltransferase